MTDEKILILGASSDLGCELIRRISAPQVQILAHYCSSKEKIEALTDIASARGARLIPLAADFRKDADVERLIASVKDACGHPTQIVHFSSPRPAPVRFEKLTWDRVENALNIQLKSLFKVLKEFLPLMGRAGSGKIVFVLSSYTINVPPKALADYVTAKYSLLGLMKALASEYADKGVSINAVSPSMAETRFLSELPAKLVEMTADNHPQKRNARPDDIVPLIQFLLSKESSFITGANVPIAGGLVF